MTNNNKTIKKEGSRVFIDDEIIDPMGLLMLRLSLGEVRAKRLDQIIEDQYKLIQKALIKYKDFPYVVDRYKKELKVYEEYFNYFKTCPTMVQKGCLSPTELEMDQYIYERGRLAEENENNQTNEN